MTATPHCSRPNPTWYDVYASIEKLDDFSRRMPVLRQNLNNFDNEVDCLSCMLKTLMAKTDKQSRSALRSSVTNFLSSADEFLEFAATAAPAGDISYDNKLVKTWGKRWRKVRQDLETLSDDVSNFCE